MLRRTYESMSGKLQRSSQNPVLLRSQPKPDDDTLSEDDLGIVRVNNFSRCACGDKEYDNFHVKVNMYEVKLQIGNAVAISYGIGDFGRAQHLFGHTDGDIKTPIKLQFGEEWDLQALMETLITICEDNAAIWFDQLSITQDPESIPNELKRIPKIYSTFDTVIVLPNAPCPCLQEAVTRFENGDKSITIDGPAHNRDSKDLSGRAVTEACVNAVPQCSYYDRLWTLQEFTYARCISVRFCTPPPPKCPSKIPLWFKSEAGMAHAMSHMNRYSRREFDIIMRDTKDLGSMASYAASSLLSLGQQETESRLELLVGRFQHRGGTQAGSEFYEGAKLLLGNTLRRGKTDHEADFLGQVIWAVGMRTRHKASVIEDYVLATFPAYDGYQVPPNLNQANLADLLEDAVRQWEHYNNRIQLTTVPRGIFEGHGSTVLCQPKLYLSPLDIRCLSDVYCVFQIASVKALTPEGHLPIAFRTGEQSTQSRMIYAQTYEQAFGDAKTQTALEFMRRAAGQETGRPRRTWGKETETVRAYTRMSEYKLDGRSQGPHNTNDFASFEEAVDSFRALVTTPGQAPNTIALNWEFLPEIDHHAVVYNILARWMGLDPKIAREKGLGLVVTVEPPCVGFVNKTVWAEMRTQEQSEPPDKQKLLKSQWLSVNVCSRRLSHDSSFVYETVHRGETMKPKLVQGLPRDARVPIYHVVGIWLDSSFDDASIGADLSYDGEEWDAVLL